MLCSIVDHSFAGGVDIRCGQCKRLVVRHRLQLHLLPVCRLSPLQSMRLWLLPSWG